MSDALETLARIQATARAIREATSCPVSYRELHHEPRAGSAIDVAVYLQNDDGAAFWWQGSSNPIGAHDMPLEEMHEAMLAWLVEYRKGREAA